MRYIITSALAIITVISFLLIGCNTGSDDDGTPNFDGTVTGRYSDYFSSAETWNGEETYGLMGGNTGDPKATATLPQYWWRAIDSYEYETTITNYNGEKATVSLTTTYIARMWIDRTNDGQINPHTKPVTMTSMVRGEFVKSGEEWLLSRISPINFVCTDENDQTVSITSVRLKGETFDRTYTDPEEMLTLDQLPLFQPGEEVTVTITTSNTSAEGWVPATFGFVNHDNVRDDCTNMGNGVWEKKYIIADNVGAHHGAANIVDAGTLQNETEDDHNSQVWCIPYHVGSIPTM